MRRLILAALLAWSAVGFGQYDPLRPPNTFDSDDNPLYWKNKKPHGAYWQQDVHYTIHAKLDDERDVIEATMALKYMNNSPDTLKQLVFHLYQNAFDSGSYAGQKRGVEPKPPYQRSRMSNVTVDGIAVDVEMDNTVVFIKLSTPMLPGEKRTVECNFRTEFAGRGGRMKMYNAWGFKHYNVVHWYPRISVYDNKFGWTTDQHLGHEFYGDFGCFDVTLEVPAPYILDGTGNLLNRTEVLPESLMKQIDIANFKDKPWNEEPSTLDLPKDQSKIWKFHAENVHDFAWTADPTYRIGTATAELKDGTTVTCYSLAQEPHASGWQNAADYAARVIEVYSRDFGPYAYHKMIVADARDGMEYPMLTLDGGRDPGYRGLLAHEIGHNWFYGMVGNNESYRAALDEGFTQFLTAWSLTELEGDSVGVGRRNFLSDAAILRSQRDRNVYDGYYFASVINDDQTRLNVHSDQFHPGYLYGQVYSKTAVMLYNLQYVLGDALFLKAMKSYFLQWRFCHPYFEDFRESVIHTTKVDLNWFFDQWLETEEVVDFAVEGLQRKGKHTYELKLRRKGMQMPLDFQVETSSGKRIDYHIPNTYFEKKTEAILLPKWYGWGAFNADYSVLLESDEPIVNVQIDPSKRLADIYQLDNSLKMPVDVRLNDFKVTRPEQAYEIEWNPIAWYNGFDGVKAGLELRSHYASVYHKLHAQVWFNSGLGQQTNEFDALETDGFDRFNYRLEYEDPMRSFGKGYRFLWRTRFLDGLFNSQVQFSKQLASKRSTVSIAIGGLYRPEDTDLNYLLYEDQWKADQWNNFTDLEFKHRYRYGKSDGTFTATIRTPFLFSDYTYGYFNTSSINNQRVAFLNVRSRLFAQAGNGNTWAPESQLYMAGGSPEQMMDNAFTRSMGIVPADWAGYGINTGNFQYGGGLNLRGYNNYLLPEYDADSLLDFAFAGHSGAAINLELEFDDLVKVMSSLRRYIELKTYFFGDAGVLNTNRPTEALSWSSVRVDAGVGACLEIKQWGRWNELKPFDLRFDMPLFLNRPPNGEEYLAFRWLIGFQRAF